MALTTDPFDILRLHHAWAMGRLLVRCEGLSAPDWHRRFPIGPGSVHDTIVHILSCECYWHDRIRGGPVRPALDPAPLGQPQPERSPSELRTLCSACDDELRALSDDLRAQRVPALLVSRQPPGRHFTSASAFIHIFTHAFHHRAQVLNMLRQLQPTVEPLELALPDWQILCENTPSDPASLT